MRSIRGWFRLYIEDSGLQEARGQGVVAEKCEKRELTLRGARVIKAGHKDGK